MRYKDPVLTSGVCENVKIAQFSENASLCNHEIYGWLATFDPRNNRTIEICVCKEVRAHTRLFDASPRVANPGEQLVGHMSL